VPYDITKPKVLSQNPEFFGDSAGQETNPIYAGAKRFCEFFAVITVATPVLLTIALAILAILWTTGRPVLVTRERVGKGGRIFKQVKLRTRIGDSASEPAQVNLVGRFLEDSCLAELPQLWNVIVGDMSLVGPSPESPHNAKLNRERLPNYELRQIVRPGITGYAQVYLGSASSSTTLEYDLYYVRHKGAALDVKILWRSVFPDTRHTRV
jgi:lipopolysaccharide/colanic/teichoic acid biosynthesis glycosyltransferase